MLFEKREKLLWDTECAVNWWCVNFMSRDGKRRKCFELYEGHPLDRTNVLRIIRDYTLVGFNSGNYDNVMLRMALRVGVTNKQLKALNDAIILRKLKPWEAEEEFNLPVIPKLDSIDLIEPAPSVKVSLKLYMGRLNSRTIQDLPFDPTQALDRELQLLTSEYCFNDLEGTGDLLNHIEPQIDLRTEMSEQYGIDLRSKSDAQIAEAVIRSELEKIRGEKIYKPQLPSDYSFKYQVPDFISFRTPQMQNVLETVRDATFKLTKKEVREDTLDDEMNTGVAKVKISGVQMPKEIKGLRIQMGSSTYKMGIGGLHSQEKNVSHYADKHTILRDADVAAFYPAILLVCQLYPEHLGPDFLKVYRAIRERRMSAKETIKQAKKLLSMGIDALEEAVVRGDMRSAQVIDMTLKIVLNGTFGKLGSKWSFLYSPNLMIQVTMTGQLALLMLIEELELNDISVISANTDGIVSKFDPSQADEYHRIVKGWEQRTGFEMEFTDYKSLHSMSVNSYIAIKTNGEVKQKGLCAFAGSKGSPAEKNPQNYVVTDAVVNYLTKGTPLEDTIEWCPDVRRFLTVRRVTGGAEWRGQHLGKVVRWYRGKGAEDPIRYATGDKLGDKVPKSDGAVPMMTLGDLPLDLDHDYYVAEARRMIVELGVL